MSGKSSRLAASWSALEPVPDSLFGGQPNLDDPRLGQIVRRWQGGAFEATAAQAVLLGFACDEGVRRNRGRIGAAQAPTAIREQLFRFTTWDPLSDVDLATLEVWDLGTLRVGANLEEGQDRLGELVAEILSAGAVPVILGGGHETAFGHYLGYAKAKLDCAILNVDAHLDVRPFPQGSHSGSPFRQAMQHKPHPLKPGCYAVIGAQRQAVAREHCEFVHNHDGRIHWLEEYSEPAAVGEVFSTELKLLGQQANGVLVTIDADAFSQADVPGVSAPSPVGLDGRVGPELARRAGTDSRVRSLEIVEVNPEYDRDNQTARWGALCVRQFLVGLASRSDQSERET
jgi:formiminoglutamase